MERRSRGKRLYNKAVPLYNNSSNNKSNTRNICNGNEVKRVSSQILQRMERRWNTQAHATVVISFFLLRVFTLSLPPVYVGAPREESYSAQVTKRSNLLLAQATRSGKKQEGQKKKRRSKEEG
jgi:hypothetical protein